MEKHTKIAISWKKTKLQRFSVQNRKTVVKRQKTCKGLKLYEDCTMN